VERASADGSGGSAAGSTIRSAAADEPDETMSRTSSEGSTDHRWGSDAARRPDAKQAAPRDNPGDAAGSALGYNGASGSRDDGEGPRPR
jgi:hypothetical protein